MRFAVAQWAPNTAPAELDETTGRVEVGVEVPPGVAGCPTSSRSTTSCSSTACGGSTPTCGSNNPRAGPFSASATYAAGGPLQRHR